MISCILQGGLGNQMFQIAATISLASDNDDRAIFSVNESYVPLQGNELSQYADNIFKNVDIRKGNFPIKTVYQEKGHEYQSIPYQKGMILKGYFQSEKYFEDYKDYFVNLFSMPWEERRKYKELNLKDCLGLHVRRGDYLNNPNIHPFNGVDYIQRALGEFNLDDYESVFVCSDDVQWCKNNLDFIENVKFSLGSSDYMDLWLLSQCKDFIISNSTFSWWSAWLKENSTDKPTKIVAPKDWFGIDGPSDKDIVPKRWSKI